MLEYARWKYILVSVVLLIALVFALPNVFGEDLALAVATKDHTDMTQDGSKSVQDFLKGKSIPFKKADIEAGRLIVRFDSVTQQLAARDAVTDQYKDKYISALAFAPRTPAFLRKVGLRPMSLGLDLRGGLSLLYQVDINSAVTQLLDGYAQDARKVLAGAKIPYKDVAQATVDSDRPNAVRVTLPP